MMTLQLCLASDMMLLRPQQLLLLILILLKNMVSLIHPNLILNYYNQDSLSIWMLLTYLQAEKRSWLQLSEAEEACLWVEFQEFGTVMPIREQELLVITGVGLVIVLVTLAFRTAQVTCLKEIRLLFG